MLCLRIVKRCLASEHRFLLNDFENFILTLLASNFCKKYSFHTTKIFSMLMKYLKYLAVFIGICLAKAVCGQNVSVTDKPSQ